MTAAARAGESRPTRRSIPGYTLDRAHTAHALTLTGALVRRDAVGAEPRADRDGDGSRRSDGCRLPDDVRGPRNRKTRAWESGSGLTGLTQSGIAGGRRKAKRAVIFTEKQLAKKRTDMRNDAMRNRPTRQELDKWSFESRHEARSTYPHEWRVPSCPRSRSR